MLDPKSSSAQPSAPKISGAESCTNNPSLFTDGTAVNLANTDTLHAEASEWRDLGNTQKS